MSPRLTLLADRALTVLRIALVLLSAAVILLPEERASVLATMFRAAFFVNAAIDIARAWKRGDLTRTPGEIYQEARKNGPWIMRTPLERWAAGSSVLAFLVLTFA